ncbi:EscU/YscU/HrcU family type III secretion system export apparatus switch protein [Priestia taiwanensis]|uniref:Flagellar biosynthetic protein FlhB n=1 Tax=Priestia taiwanensis TaxID=1347902 RepID=A0A917APV3_9BACI|nr:EscU/YscU/HrcU family type III secretion system export apparatus switch protein [Priestia taiwanensis]MBM7362857.1 flagellar biosynthesis protein [Priestia taiwanensis]GGE65714.1 flagellar biosynthetic protein FlhB [Priestia taiwanensis]
MMEKRREVVALKYDQFKQDAPYVVAKGRGLVADEILAKAKEHDIPVQEDPSLLEVLSKLEINESIPEELYQVVAEVFAFIYRVDKHYKG